MSYDFDGSTQSLSSNSDFVTFTDYPFTMYARAKSPDNTVSGIFLSYCQAVSPYSGLAMWFLGAFGGDPIYGNRFGVSGAIGPTFSVDTWYSVGYRAAASTDTDINVDGSATPDVVPVSWVSPNLFQVGIGSRLIPSVTNPFKGSIACAAFWDVALTDDEMVSLAKGFSPRRIRPQNIQFYAPLVREAVMVSSPSGPYVLTNTGSAPASDHPRTYGM